MKLLSSLLAESDEMLKPVFSGEAFVESLKFMGIGLVCIFAVVGVIALGVTLLNKLTKKKKPENDDEEEED